MTDRIEEIREREKKATVGPWDVSDASELRVTWRPDHDHEFEDKNAPICHMRWTDGKVFHVTESYAELAKLLFDPEED